MGIFRSIGHFIGQLVKIAFLAALGAAAGGIGGGALAGERQVAPFAILGAVADGTVTVAVMVMRARRRREEDFRPGALLLLKWQG